MSAEPGMFACFAYFISTAPLIIIIPYFKLNVCDLNDVCGHVKSTCFCVLLNVYVCLDHVLNIFLSFLENVP